MKKRQAVSASILVLLLVLAFPAVCSARWKWNANRTRCYNTSTHKYAKSSWERISGKWYYFDDKGYIKTGRFRVGNNYYYVRKSSGRASNEKIKNYFYGKDGAAIKNRWKKIGKNWFYFGANGKLKTGRFQVKNQTYYCTKTKGRVTKKRVGDYYYNKNGVMVKNRFVGDYYYGKNGKAKYGKFVVDGDTYYCIKKSGIVRNRWYKKRFYDEDGKMVTNSWIGKGKNKCYVNGKGVITKGNKNPKDPPSEKDIRLLAALVYWESGNQSYEGKVAVASVVVNRMESSRFPDTLKGVIYQSGQFDPAMNGTLDSLYHSGKKIQSDCTKAAKEVLTGGSKLKGYYYFNCYSGRKQIGNHYFS